MSLHHLKYVLLLKCCTPTHTYQRVHKLIRAKFLENSFYFKQMYLFGIVIVGLVFKILFPHRNLVLLFLNVFWAYWGFFTSFVEEEGDEVRFPFIGGGMGGLCHQGLGWVQHLLTWRCQDHPGTPNGCKVVYFGFSLNKYRTLFFALVPILPTNYLLPLMLSLTRCS